MFQNAATNTRTIKALLQGAEDRARELGDETPGPEHLLLAALGLEDGSARDALAAHGVTADGLREAIGRSHADALGLAQTPDARPVTTRGAVFQSTGTLQQAFRRAAELSKKDPSSDRRFRGAHVVIAVAELEHGTSARVLDLLGVARDDLVASARRALAG